MRWCIAFALVAAAVVAVYLGNASWLAPQPADGPQLLAHRGVHQTFRRDGLTADTCTATQIDTPRHGFIENTIASMRAAFEAGADIVELDIHPTTDGHFVVFHDWTLDCRTDGRGVTREHNLAELKALDIGYGYTAEGGKTFPLRGTGIGLMPTLDEVLAAFPNRRLLIDIKSNDPSEGMALANRLASLPEERGALLMAMGGDGPIAELRRHLPQMRTVSRPRLTRCLMRYAALGWTGAVPEACRDMLVLVPVDLAPWLWGWPNRFVARMRAAGSEVFALGPYDSGFSAGIDGPDDLARLPQGFGGGIWTNRIETIGPQLRAMAGR